MGVLWLLWIKHPCAIGPSPRVFTALVMAARAEAIERAVLVGGGTRLTGIQPKGPRVRELEKGLQGTWRAQQRDK